MSVCVVCGSADFGDPHDGLFFCLECGTQSQDVRVEVSQVEDGSKFTRRLKKKKGKSKKSESSTESGGTDHHVLLTFQRIIKQQCDALIKLGFNSSVKEAARLIWFTYLRHYGYAFKDHTTVQSSHNIITGCNNIQQQQQQQQQQQTSSYTPSSDSLRNTETNTGSEVYNKKSNHSGKSKGKGRKRPHGEDMTVCSSNDKKRPKLTSTEESVGYDTFPDDKFLFEEESTQPEDKRQNDTVSKKKVSLNVNVNEIDMSECVRIMESISNWEELDELERSMDCKQLLVFRQAYLSSRGPKPKFIAKGEPWADQPRVFKLHMTISVLYLALLYTEQHILLADIIRWVRLEKIPLNTLLKECSKHSNKTDTVKVFFTTTLVTTVGVHDQTLKLYHHLPLPPVPSQDPHAISHIIIERLQLTDCFKRLVDRALDTVYLPIGFTSRNRIDSECAAVIVMMLRVLYGLDDHIEMTITESTDDIGPGDGTNSLPVWVDWVQLHCTNVSKIDGNEKIPLELSTVNDCQSYLQFCRETVFTRCRPVPARAKSYRELDPAFSQKISGIFASVSKSSTTDSLPNPTSNLSSSPQPHPPLSSHMTRVFPRLVHLSHFIQSSKAPCTVYHPLPTVHRYREEFDDNQLSHAMNFILSVLCQIIDVPLQGLYRVLVSVEKSFIKGKALVMKNINQDFLSK